MLLLYYYYTDVYGGTVCLHATPFPPDATRARPCCWSCGFYTCLPFPQVFPYEAYTDLLLPQFLAAYDAG